MKSLAAVLPSPAPTVIAPPPTDSSHTLPHGLTEMAGMMTQQQLSVAMTPRQIPLTRDEARVLQQWWRAIMSYRTSLRADLDSEDGQNHLRSLIEKHGPDIVYKTKSLDGRPKFNQPIYLLPLGATIEGVHAVILEMCRPACPQSVIRVSQVMARKPLFNNDEISAKNAIADTHELLAGYSDFVYFMTCQEALDSDEKYFPIPANWKEWADDNARSIGYFKDLFNVENNLRIA